MVRVIRILGLSSICIGILLIVTYFIEPLRFLWRLYRSIDLPLQIGFGVAGAGLCIILMTMLLERYSLRAYDRNLKDNLPES